MRATGLQSRERQHEFGTVTALPKRMFLVHAAPGKDGGILQIWPAGSELHTKERVSPRSQDGVEEEQHGDLFSWIRLLQEHTQEQGGPVKKPWVAPCGDVVQVGRLCTVTFQLAPSRRSLPPLNPQGRTPASARTSVSPKGDTTKQSSEGENF